MSDVKEGGLTRTQAVTVTMIVGAVAAAVVAIYNAISQCAPIAGA